jgi:nucleotide-binding universal stress UspA family protein
MIFLKNILVTTDLSDHSLAALEYAASFALLYTSHVSLLYVVEQGPHRSKEEAQKALQEFVETRVSRDLKVAPEVRIGHPAEEIRKFAEEQGADLIVMATHGRTGLRHIVLGSVAEKTVRLSTVPVLTVKPRSFREGILHNEDVERELHLR